MFYIGKGVCYIQELLFKLCPPLPHNVDIIVIIIMTVRRGKAKPGKVKTSFQKFPSDAITDPRPHI